MPGWHHARMRHSEDWKRLIDDQLGIIGAGQLREHGYSKHDSDYRVASGQWLHVLYGVFSVTNGPLTWPMMLSAALVYGGGSAVLSHDTAAEQWGMLRRHSDPEPVHITVPYGRSAVNQPATYRRRTPRETASAHELVHPGVLAHRSRAIQHTRVDAEFPMTSGADTALDLATAAPTARDGMIELVQAVTNGKLSPIEVRRRCESRPPWRYKKAIHETLDLLTGGVQSALEHRYVLDVEAAHGLPLGRRQGRVVVDDRVLFEDVDYSAHGVPLIVRLDGARYHSGRSVKFRDRRRDNAAELSNRPRLVYGWEEVTSSPCEVFEEVRSVLVREGWPDASYPCADCTRAWKVGA